MRKRIVVALVAALMAVGTVAVAAGTSTPVGCTITDTFAAESTYHVYRIAL